MRWLPIAVIAVAAATTAAVAAEAPTAVRVPLVAIVMLALPGIGLWRGLRLRAGGVSLAALVVVTSLICDVVVAQALLLADRLQPVQIVTALGTLALVGSLRDLRGSTT